MSKKFKNNIRPLSSASWAAPRSTSPRPSHPNLAAKFMRENQAGSLPDEDTPAMTLAGEPVSQAAPPLLPLPPLTNARYPRRLSPQQPPLPQRMPRRAVRPKP